MPNTKRVLQEEKRCNVSRKITGNIRLTTRITFDKRRHQDAFTDHPGDSLLSISTYYRRYSTESADGYFTADTVQSIRNVSILSNAWYLRYCVVQLCHLLLHSVMLLYICYCTMQLLYPFYCTVYVTLPMLLHSVVTLPILMHSVVTLHILMHSVVTSPATCTVYVTLHFLLYNIVISPMLLYSVVTYVSARCMLLLPMLQQCSYFTRYCTVCFTFSTTQCSYFTYVTAQCCYLRQCTVYVMLLQCSYFTHVTAMQLLNLCYCTVQLPTLVHGICYFTCYCSVRYVTGQCSYFTYVTAQCSYFNYVTAQYVTFIHTWSGTQRTRIQFYFHQLQICVFLCKYFSLIAAEYKMNTNNGNCKHTAKPTDLFTFYPDIQLVAMYK